MILASEREAFRQPLSSFLVFLVVVGKSLELTRYAKIFLRKASDIRLIYSSRSNIAAGQEESVGMGGAIAVVIMRRRRWREGIWKSEKLKQVGISRGSIKALNGLNAMRN